MTIEQLHAENKKLRAALREVQAEADAAYYDLHGKGMGRYAAACGAIKAIVDYALQDEGECPECTTHYQNDGCGDPVHNDPPKLECACEEVNKQGVGWCPLHGHRCKDCL